MELIMIAFTTIALNQAIGFNAILPLLIIAVLGSFEVFFASHGLPAPVSLPENFIFMTSWWCIGFLLILTLLEQFGDKISWLDNIKHVTVDPISRALSSTGTTYAYMAVPVSKIIYNHSGVINGIHPCIGLIGGFDERVGFWIIMILLMLSGLCISFFFLFIKAALRWFISILPDMGIGNFLVSLLEDCIVIISVILALFAPVLAVFFTLFLATAIFLIIRTLRNRANEREKAEIRNLCFVKGVI